MIKLRLDMIMLEKGISLQELASKVGITNANMSNIKTGKINAIRFSTLDAICKILDCQPGDILKYVEDDLEENSEIDK
ncbi:MAG: helix-turn-helix transcriptional regulator [Acholeplasmatales bacterium]|nr:helix-turn-helix transcriptional regulator [Acholeplasmatales bacterium]